jgi:hypothetical protein
LAYIIGDMATWIRVKPPFGLHIFFEKWAGFQQMYYAHETVVSEANAGNRIHLFSGTHRYVLAIHQIYHSAVLSYCIIPNTPRGGVTGNEMGDMVVSN